MWPAEWQRRIVAVLERSQGLVDSSKGSAACANRLTTTCFFRRIWPKNCETLRLVRLMQDRWVPVRPHEANGLLELLSKSLDSADSALNPTPNGRFEH